MAVFIDCAIFLSFPRGSVQNHLSGIMLIPKRLNVIRKRLSAADIVVIRILEIRQSCHH
jgi:hypothetical protein